MPSYTFNSNTAIGRHPTHLGGARFALALLVMLFLAGGALEMFWRSKGHYPIATDTISLWGLHVDKVSKLDSNAVVIVGSSRVQLGLDPEIIGNELNASKVVQLARAAGAPMPVLEYIAEETDYGGLVVCDVTPGIVFEAEERGRKPLEDALARREGRPFYAPLEESLLNRSQSLICLNNASLSWELAGNGLFRGNWPPPPYAHFHKSRYIQADYSRCGDIDTLLNNFLNRIKTGTPMTDEGLEKLVNQLSDLSETFDARGGRLVFVRMPSSGTLWEVEKKEYPKDKYWQALKRRFGANAIHFHELEDALERPFNCPDGSHLDYRDSELITVELCRKIK